MKIYRTGGVSTITSADAIPCAFIVPNYEVDQYGLLLFCPRSGTKSEDCAELIRLVILELLQQYFLHHYYTSLEGGHQGIGRNTQRIRAKFHWRGLYRSVQRVMWEIVWIVRQVKAAARIELARRVTYKQRTVSKSGDKSYSFFAAIVQNEHGAVHLGRSVL